MKSIVELARHELKWTQPKALKNSFELHSDDQVVGTLVLKSIFGSFATGTSADGCWTFKRVGFFQTRVTIRRCDDETDIGTFRNSTWKAGGTLELPDGRKYRATSNLWQSKLEFQDPSGNPIIKLKTGGLMHLSAGVEIEPAAARIPELPWMVMLGWYLAVMMKNDSAGAAAAGG